MITIGIIGANGQVGSEICLYLSKIGNIQVVPICRTEFGSNFLTLCGLDCRHGNISNPDEAKQLLDGCDLVADFTYLKGLPSEIKATSKAIITNVMKYAPPHARFVYASSIMAFGMGKNNPVFKSYLFARSVYGAMKRYSEKLAWQLSKQYKREAYILRIGQVHGELQAVSRKLLRELKNELALIPNSLSYTIFPFTIAEALVNIARGKEKPGVYTLVSKPEWSWEEVYEHYCEKACVNPKIVLTKNTNTSKVKSIKQNFTNFIFKILSHYAEVIASYLLVHFPKIEHRLMAVYYIQKAKNQLLEGKNNIYNPFYDFHPGTILGKRLETLSDSRTSMKELNTEVSKLITSILDKQYSQQYLKVQNT